MIQALLMWICILCVIYSFFGIIQCTKNIRNCNIAIKRLDEYGQYVDSLTLNQRLKILEYADMAWGSYEEFLDEVCDGNINYRDIALK